MFGKQISNIAFSCPILYMMPQYIMTDSPHQCLSSEQSSRCVTLTYFLFLVFLQSETTGLQGYKRESSLCLTRWININTHASVCEGVLVWKQARKSKRVTCTPVKSRSKHGSLSRPRGFIIVIGSLNQELLLIRRRLRLPRTRRIAFDGDSKPSGNTLLIIAVSSEFPKQN